MSTTSDRSQAEGALVEIGWVVASGTAVSAELVEDVTSAAEHLQAELGRLFPHYRFRCVLLQRALPASPSLRPLMDLIELGALERDTRRWDFAFVVTDEELHAYHKPFTLGAPASSLNVAAMSVARLRPVDGVGTEASGRQVPTERLTALFFHLFGHLNDLPHAPDASDYMHPPDGPESLDEMTGFSKAARAALDQELAKEADPRVEEEGRQRGTVRFYIEAAFRNRRDILQSVLKARPWSFVFRLSKLATTAASTLIILMLTAESWDLGTRQRSGHIALASVVAILATATYVLRRQGLLGRARARDLTEQRVAANLSVGLVVVLAMLTTYLCLFAVSLSFGELAFSKELLSGWVGARARPPGHGDYLTMAGFVATLGVLLGALGASFEGEQYFRHAVVVDEET